MSTDKRMVPLLCLLAAVLAAAPARAFLGFGLGKAAAKRSSRVIQKAKESRPQSAARQAASVSSRLKWAYYGESVDYSSPAIAPDGTVYFGTSDHFVYYNGYWSQNQRPPAKAYGLYAYNPDGTLKWKYSDGTDAPVRGSPAIGPDGTVYIVLERLGTTKALTEEELHAVTPGGVQKWKVTISTCYAEVGALSPVVAADGTVYVAGRNFTAFNPNGTVKWREYASQSSTSLFFGTPAIASDGTVYTVWWATANPYGQELRAFNPDGTVRWTSPSLGNYPITGSPAIAADGTVYIGIRDDLALSGAGNAALIAFLPAGTIRWIFPAVDFDIRSQPSIDADGTIYFGTKGSNGFVYALNPDGTQKWRFTTADPSCPGCGTDVYNTPAIGADGTIYVGNELNVLYAFNPDGSVRWKDSLLPGGAAGSSSAAIAADGTLYMGKIYGAFVAVQVESLGLSAGADWPRFHYSNDSAGRRP